MFGGGEGASRGPGLDRLGGLVLAMVAGVLVPVIAVLAVASRNPVPRDCTTGQATPTTVEGAVVYTTGADLWYSEGLPGRPRKLVDFAPPRARPSAAGSPSASAAPGSSPAAAASPLPSASPLPTASPSPAPPVPRILAADVSSDRKVIALMVLDPPERPGSMALKLLSPGDPAGTPPLAPWYDEKPDRGNLKAVAVHVLESGKILLFEPEPAPVTEASPAPAVPAPAPSASASALPSPSQAATEAGSVAVQAVIVASGPSPSILAQGSQSFLFTQGHTQWPDARGYRVPPALPVLRDRVDGLFSRAAGIAARDVTTPLVSRRLRELAVGTAGQPGTQPVCTLDAASAPGLFSPDESELALRKGDQTLLLDLSGAHSAAPLLQGVLLAWRS